MQDALISFGVGLALGVGVVPTVYVTARFMQHHNKLDATVFRDVDPMNVITTLVIGTAVTSLLAIIEYFERVFRGGEEVQSASRTGDGGQTTTTTGSDSADTADTSAASPTGSPAR